MTTIEVMHKALEALQTIGERFGPVRGDLIFSKRDAIDKADAAAPALRAEIERLEAVEPVAWLITGGRLYKDQVVLLEGSADTRIADREDGSRKVPLYTAPSCQLFRR
jgi:hypothetical protein